MVLFSFALRTLCSHLYTTHNTQYTPHRHTATRYTRPVSYDLFHSDVRGKTSLLIWSGWYVYNTNASSRAHTRTHSRARRSKQQNISFTRKYGQIVYQITVTALMAVIATVVVFVVIYLLYFFFSKQCTFNTHSCARRPRCAHNVMQCMLKSKSCCTWAKEIKYAKECAHGENWKQHASSTVIGIHITI